MEGHKSKPALITHRHKQNRLSKGLAEPRALSQRARAENGLKGKPSADARYTPAAMIHSGA